MKSPLAHPRISLAIGFGRPSLVWSAPGRGTTKRNIQSLKAPTMNKTDSSLFHHETASPLTLTLTGFAPSCKPCAPTLSSQPRTGIPIRYSLALFLAILALWLTPSVQAVEAQLVRDAQGNGRYMFLLDEQIAALEDKAGELPERATMDPANATDIYGWHKPNVRALVKRLESTYGVRALVLTSHALPAFSAYVPEATLQRMRGEPAIDRIEPIYERSVTFSAWSDQLLGSELVPWGKSAIGTNDALSTSNRVYMIDGGAQTHIDLNFVVAPVNPTWGSLFPQHANHVAGILGARTNNIAVRGVNPGALIVSVNRGNIPDEMYAALDWVLADTEQNRIYAVANFSTNWNVPPPGVDPVGVTFEKYMRRVSNRVLVVQSAGNDRLDACDRAYSATNSSDGVLVVGGIDALGQLGFPFDNTHIPGFISEAGSAWGECVEVWAPSKSIWSTWSTSSTEKERLSGTSMAAPHVSALAARYGTTSTTPVEREKWIRAKVFHTGFNADDGFPITVPSYTQPPSTGLPSRLIPVAASADATLLGTSPYSLFDGLYLTDSWNAGHYAPAWVQFDLGSPKIITGIRLTPEQFPAGSVTHHVYAGNAPLPSSLVATLSSPVSANLEPLSAGISTTARYVLIYTAASPSWVAFREIEIYGYSSPPPPRDSVGIYATASGNFFLKNSNTNGSADVVFGFGGAGHVPLKGDWDNNGTDTIGVYAPTTGMFFLRNSNTAGAADITFQFGAGGLGLVPITGDWNGDGIDTIGLYDPASGSFFLRNSNTSGPADIVFGFGAGGAVPIVGDWDGNGTDTIGIYITSSGAFFLKNTNASGSADVIFTFGAGGSVPITGDWNNDGTDTIGIYDTVSGNFFLKNTNSGGSADVVLTFGSGGAVPLAGNWDGLQ